MRVILTANFSPWSPYSGGAQRSTHNLAVALARRGHTVTVVYTKAIGERIEPPGPVPYRIAWAPFVGLRSRRQAPLRPLNAVTVAAVVRGLSREGADVVHGNGEEAALCAGDRRTRLVMTPRYPDYPAPLLRPGGPSLAERVRIAVVDAKYLVLGHALRRADLVCPTSESAAAMVEQAYALPRARIRVVPNGIDEAFTAVARRQDAANGPVVFFGRLSHGKGVDTLVQALIRLGDAAPRCVIVGRGEDEATVLATARAHGLADRVELRGWLSSQALAQVLAGARMAVLPSREESFGNAIAEAMAVGVAVVSTRVGSVPELVDDGRTGLLVAPGDASALADAMRRLLDDAGLAQTLGAAARARVRDRYTWDAVAAQYERCYEGSA